MQGALLLLLACGQVIVDETDASVSAGDALSYGWAGGYGFVSYVLADASGGVTVTFEAAVVNGWYRVGAAGAAVYAGGGSWSVDDGVTVLASGTFDGAGGFASEPGDRYRGVWFPAAAEVETATGVLRLVLEFPGSWEGQIGYVDAVGFFPSDYVSFDEVVMLDAANAIAWLLMVIALASCWILGGVLVRLLFLFKNQRRFW